MSEEQNLGTRRRDAFANATLYVCVTARHERGDLRGTRFSVWAPNAQTVRVVGDFNHWNGEGHTLTLVPGSGVWALFVAPEAQGLGIGQGDPVVITSAHGEAQATAHLTPDIRQDTVFLAFHFAGAGSANLLTGGPTDPVSGMPEFKTTPVRVTRLIARAQRDDQVQEVYA